MHAVYYDFGQHCQSEPNWMEDEAYLTFTRNYLELKDKAQAIEFLSSAEPIGYRGAFSEGKEANDLKLSSIEKTLRNPICFISFNRDAYSQHCRSYAEYQRWVKERNPERYRSNLDKTYDSKNMMHMFRLVHMASEIAEGRGVILERTHDRQFLMDVRNHKFEYDELMAKLEEDTARMNALMATSTIPDRIDPDFVNSLIIEIRNRQFG